MTWRMMWRYVTDLLLRSPAGVRRLCDIDRLLHAGLVCLRLQVVMWDMGGRADGWMARQASRAGPPDGPAGPSGNEGGEEASVPVLKHKCGALMLVGLRRGGLGGGSMVHAGCSWERGGGWARIARHHPPPGSSLRERAHDCVG